MKKYIIGLVLVEIGGIVSDIREEPVDGRSCEVHSDQSKNIRLVPARKELLINETEEQREFVCLFLCIPAVISLTYYEVLRVLISYSSSRNEPLP